jgi:hypothetical protein
MGAGAGAGAGAAAGTGAGAGAETVGGGALGVWSGGGVSEDGAGVPTAGVVAALLGTVAGVGAGTEAGAVDGAGAGAGVGAEIVEGGALGVWSRGGVTEDEAGVPAAGVVAAPLGTVAGVGVGTEAGAADGAGADAGAGAEAADGGALVVWSGGGVSEDWSGAPAAGVVAALLGTVAGVGAFVVSCAWAHAMKRPLATREVTIRRMGESSTQRTRLSARHWSLLKPMATDMKLKIRVRRPLPLCTTGCCWSSAFFCMETLLHAMTISQSE